MKYLLILTLLLTELALAQQLITIKGPEHPELIPDQAAAIAVFGVHSDTANAANTEKHHTKLRLSADDHAIYDGAMATLRSYPKDRGSTYDYLLERLSPDGQAKLKAFIQSEKPHMQYQIHPPVPEGREDFVVDVGGTWTIYYTENFTSHGDLSITITPQVSISGDDGGYCPTQSGFYGFDTPSVMLHGNTWQAGPSFVSAAANREVGNPCSLFIRFLM